MRQILTTDVEQYLDAVTQLDLFHSRGDRIFSQRGNLEFYLDYLFRDIEFKDKVVIDIGAGAGVFSCYAAVQGARLVVSLEPEAGGSTQGVARKFEKLVDRLSLRNVVLSRCTLQEFDEEQGTFDIVLLHNSINHLDEDACIKLQYSDDARVTYQKLFEKISAFTKSGSILIAADCSRYNFFALLRVANPFSPGMNGTHINLLNCGVPC